MPSACAVRRSCCSRRGRGEVRPRRLAPARGGRATSAQRGGGEAEPRPPTWARRGGAATAFASVRRRGGSARADTDEVEKRDLTGGPRAKTTQIMGEGCSLSGFGSLRVSVKRFYTLGLKLKLWEELRGVTWTSSKVKANKDETNSNLAGKPTILN